MKSSMALISALTLALALAAPALADKHEGGGHGKSHHHHAQHMERMAEKLELSDQQRAEMSAVREEHGPRLRELRGEIREARKALREAAAVPFDEGAARPHAEELGRLSGEAALLSARMHAEMHDVLSEEQRDRMAKMRKKHQEKRGDRMKHGDKQRGKHDH